MRLVRLVFVVLGFGVFVSGCNTQGQPIFFPPASTVYWTFDNSTGHQLETAAYPLTNTSPVTLTIDRSIGNGLNGASPLLFDSSGRLWVGNPGPSPSTISVFTLPLSASSSASFILTLTGCVAVFGMAFDHNGNLWAGCNGSGDVIEYTGPFTTTATLTAANTLVVPQPGYPAFDAAGNLYVARDSVPYRINVFTAPIGLGATPARSLTGVTKPFALAFDAAGNLYAGQLGSVVRYNSNNLGDLATPDIVDATGQGAGDFAGQLVFDPSGNLYYADCGNTGVHIYVFPTATQAFSTTLAPTVTFASANITASNCVWGVAVH